VCNVKVYLKIIRIEDPEYRFLSIYLSQLITYMKFKAPNLVEYMRSTSKMSGTPIDFGEFLDDFNKKTGFADNWSLMTFVIDATTLSYPFINKTASEITGHPIEALREGGIEFVSSKFRIPDRFVREIMSVQIGFLQDSKDIELENIRITQCYPIVDQNDEIRYITQQHGITHRTEDGFPLGFQGIGWGIKHIPKEIKIYQQIELFETDTKKWNTARYIEFYPEIDDNKLLSRREVEILKNISAGLNSTQIADKLHISLHTVNTHRKNMIRRTNSQNTADLLRYGVFHGLL